MADQPVHGRFDMNFVFISLTLISGFLSVAECNYEALFDYDRSKLVDVSDTFLVDQEKTFTLEQPILFYGQKYSRLQVTKDGTVSFGNDVVTFKRNPQWPRGFTELTSSSDKPFVTPFHYDAYTSPTPQTHLGRMYTTLYEKKREERVTEDTKKHQIFLNNLGKYLSHASVTVTSFTPHVYVMVTWENVTDHATINSRNLSCLGDANRPCPSATFQLLLAADAYNTFAIFNYAKMDIPYSSDHLAGMNGGKGRGWTDVVKCVGACRKHKQYRRLLSLLPSLQGSSSDRQGQALSGGRVSSDEVLGRFIFLVTDDIIVRGGCLPHDSKAAGYMDTVEVFPHQVEMLGGDIIKVSGQCQQPYSTVYCRFDQHAVTQGTVSAGMVGWCPVPRLLQRGYVRLEVSVDNITWPVFTHIIALPPGLSGSLNDDMTFKPWFTVNPSELTLTWNSTRLTRDSNAKVDIVLVQYQERGSKVTWKDLVKLGVEIPNTGRFRFNPNSDENRYRCRENCDDIQMGVIDVRLTESYRESATENQYIAIGPVPLAWYVNYAQRERRGSHWYQDQCKLWANRDKNNQAWLGELPPCPCSLQQALADWGRWQPDIACSMFNKGSKCTLDTGAKHCVLSVQPTSRAGGSRCCYDNNYNLMYAADSYHGSMSSKAHMWGAAPYAQPGRVPVMSHFLHDVVPLLHCCVWSGEDYCYLYTQQRPTPDCRHYDPPGAATIYGDPHIQTFDDERYHFGGAGDFWLVRSSGLSVQARFLERQSSAVVRKENTLFPTYISSLAVGGGANSDTVTFTLAPLEDLHPRSLDVKVNQRHYFFETKYTMWQDFRGISVVNNEQYATSNADRFHSNFTVLLKNGAGVQVAERLGLLHVVVLLPPLEKKNGQTVQEPASKGLLGSWDERKSNEYMTPGGYYVPSTENAIIKFKDFALKWAVQSDQDSLFQFHNPVPGSYPITDSIDTHLDPTLTPSDAEVSSTCGTRAKDYQNPCAYDYYMTGNRTLATNTRAALEAFQSLRRSQKKIWSCGWPEIPFAIKDNNNYTAGSTIRVTGCRRGWGSQGSLQGGPTLYTCVQNETDHQPFWDPYDNFNHGLCTDDVEDAAMFIIIGVAVAVVVIAIIVIIITLVIRKRRSRSEGVSKRKASKRDEVVEPGTDETLVKRKPRHEDSYPMSDRRQIDM